MKNFVYRFLNEENEVIYVGKTTRSISARMRAHFNNGHIKKEWLKTVEKIEYTNFNSKLEMDIAELYLINLWQPEINTSHKHADEVLIHPFDVNVLVWDTFNKWTLIELKNPERYVGEVNSQFIEELAEEKELFKYIANDCYNGNMFEYRDFLSEHEYAEDVLREGFYLKPVDLNADRIIWLFGLLEKHRKGETSKEHSIDGEKLKCDSQI